MKMIKYEFIDSMKLWSYSLYLTKSTSELNTQASQTQRINLMKICMRSGIDCIELSYIQLSGT